MLTLFKDLPLYIFYFLCKNRIFTDPNSFKSQTEATFMHHSVHLHDITNRFDPPNKDF